MVNSGEPQREVPLVRSHGRVLEPDRVRGRPERRHLLIYSASRRAGPLSVGSAVLGDDCADVRVPVDLSEFEAALPATTVGCGLFGGDRVTQVAALGTPLEP